MPYILKKYYPLRNILFFFGEGGLIFSVISIIYFFFKGPDLYFDSWILFGLRAILVTLTFQLCLYYFDLYDLSVIPSFTDAATRITQAFGSGCIALAVLYYLFPIVIITTEIFWTGYVAICFVITLWRLFYAYILDRRMFSQPILVYGTGILANDITRAIDLKKDSGCKIMGYVGFNKPTFSYKDAHYYPADMDLLKICQELKIEKIIIALDDKRGAMPAQELMTCKLHGIPITTGIRFYEQLTGKILVEKVNPSWIIFSNGFALGKLDSMIKRILDIITSLFGLIISLPILVISALIIKMESPGPILYAQERVGAKGLPFNVLKFRSMRSDAEKDGPVWASQNDTRVTRFGSFIRKVRIDEIPQMWNVLKGDMSFVGPRPERPIFVDLLEKKIPYYSLRHNVQPGITGWAQIFYPYGASEEDALRKLEFDLYYIKNFSPSMDLWILFETIKTVLFRKGSR